MGRRPKFCQEIPICSFETIAERTKSANKRQSKPPMRFTNEFEYFPKIIIKKEKTCQQYFVDGIPMKRPRGRPRVIKKEHNNYRFFGVNLTHSSEALFDQQMMSSPKLESMRFESVAIDVDSAANPCKPPMLEPILQTSNQELVSSPNLLSENINGINTIKEHILIGRLKEEVKELKRRHDSLVEQLQKQQLNGQLIHTEVTRLRAECSRLEREENRQKANIASLRQKLIEQSDNFERELRNCKLRHWCTVCLQEAKYYCCWVGSYCSQKCQNVHWKGSHKKFCRRQSN